MHRHRTITSRRGIAFGLAAALATLGAGCSDDPVAATSPRTTDTVVATTVTENKAWGTLDWRVTTAAPWSDLSLWAAPYDVTAGDTLRIYVHSASSLVNIRIYRLGWYQTSGGRLVYQALSVGARRQPACTAPFPGPVRCPWAPTLAVPIPNDWPSGIYIARVENWYRSPAAAYPFVVTTRAPHDFVVVVPQFSWQAYNQFGGSDLYVTDPSTRRNVPMVSFERPYGLNPTLRLGMAGTDGLGALQWLESQGLDLAYVSDLDLADGRITPPRHGLIFLGHDEYWTWDEFTYVQYLRDLGANLAFLGANNAYWNVRLSPGETTGLPAMDITCYKGLPDPGATEPSNTTIHFRDTLLARPENTLYGEMYNGLVPRTAAAPSLTVAPAADYGAEGTAFLAQAGLSPRLPLGLGAGHEGDGVVAGIGVTPPNLQTLLFGTSSWATPTGTTTRTFRTTFYVAHSGAGVFAAGTNQWDTHLRPAWDLPARAVQGLTLAVLHWMAAH